MFKHSRSHSNRAGIGSESIRHLPDGATGGTMFWLKSIAGVVFGLMEQLL